MGNETTLGLGGNTDYDSMIGWEPRDIKRITELAKKNVPEEVPEFLHCHTMNGWMQNVLPSSSEDCLFGPFWRKNELAIMFSSAGVGKSLLATQIAEYLARGFRMEPFDIGICGPEKVLYLDFELTREQLLSRYSSADESGLPGKHIYSFSPDVIRTEHWWNGQINRRYESFTEMLFDQVRDLVAELGIKILIVDNITFLDRASTSNTDISLGIMRRLNDLKKSEFLSILVLAHTSKSTGEPGPLTEADMQGSGNICNFADSVFALGRSVASPDLRYLKQIKTRSARIEFDGKNIPVFTLGKFDLASSMGIVTNARPPIDNFLGYSFREFCDERELCGRGKISVDSSRADLRSKARSLAGQGKAVAAIAAELGVSRSTANRYVRTRK